MNVAGSTRTRVYEIICSTCGAKFDSKSNVKGNRYCSRRCKQRSQRKDPRYQVKRVCVTCGRPFFCYSSSPTVTCSNFCATQLAFKTLKART